MGANSHCFRWSGLVEVFAGAPLAGPNVTERSIRRFEGGSIEQVGIAKRGAWRRFYLPSRGGAMLPTVHHARARAHRVLFFHFGKRRYVTLLAWHVDQRTGRQVLSYEPNIRHDLH